MLQMALLSSNKYVCQEKETETGTTFFTTTESLWFYNNIRELMEVFEIHCVRDP